MERNYDHALTDVDPEAGTAVCKTCGPTKAQRHKRARGDWWSCYTRDRQYQQVNQSRFVYGVDEDDLRVMRHVQKYRCAICNRHEDELPATGSPRLDGEPVRKLHIDHRREDGAVRGLLCANCNMGIGQLRHDPAILRAAIKYLDREVVDGKAQIERLLLALEGQGAEAPAGDPVAAG